MRVCFPVKDNLGFESAVFTHFGSAPLFVVIDTESGQAEEVGNRDLHHAHGACSPLKALDGRHVDAVVVGGIGGGALAGLGRAGVLVYRSAGQTIAENLARLRQGALEPWLPGQTCAGHGDGHGCNR